MKTIITLIVCLLALAQVVPAQANSTAQKTLYPDKPSVVVFVLDDIGQMDISRYNPHAPTTPNIDQLANEGIYFERAWVATSSCSPSRASLLTGRYPSQTGAPHLNTPLPAEQNTLAQILKESGYYTAALGKWHLGDLARHHFDKVEDLGDSTGAGNWLPTLEARPQDKPFFFWLGLRDAHDPYDAWSTPLTRLSVNERLVRPWIADIPREIVDLRDYFHEVQRADYVIGEFIAELRARQLLGNTIVVVISDNGPVQRAKTTVYNHGLLTPLIVRYPPVTAAQAGRRVSSLVSAVDVMPTILQLAGIATPASVQGLPIAELTGAPVTRAWLYAERNNHAGQHFERALRTEDYLYKRNFLAEPVCSPLNYIIKSIAPKTPAYGAEELYHLPTDPWQRNNLLNDPQHAQPLAQLRSTMSVKLREHKESLPRLQFLRCETYRYQSLKDTIRDVN